MFQCSECGQPFTRADNLFRHRRESCRHQLGHPSTSGDAMETSVVGGEGSSKRPKLNNSSSDGGFPKTQYCDVCDENIPRTSFVGHLRSNRHTRRCGVFHLGKGVMALQNAFKSRVASYRISTENYHISVVEYMTELKEKILNLIEGQLTKLNSIKINFELFGYFILEAQDLQDVKTFQTANEVVTRGTDLSHLYDNLTGRLDEKVSEFQERESGWILKQLLYIEVNVNKYNPFRATSYNYPQK